MARTMTTGWKLSESDRQSLLERFPPRYEHTIADHVTLKFGDPRELSVPGPVDARVVGQSDDGQSLQCLVVAVDGSTDRPDGSTFHITWSLGPGREARESNDVLRERGWTAIDEPLPIDLRPARF